MRGFAGVGVGLVMTIILGGCGGSSPSSQVSSTVKTYLRAIANGKATVACDQITGTEIQALEQTAQKIGASTCEQAITYVSQRLGGDNKQALLQARVIDVQVSGDSATARLKGGRSTVHLKKTAGHWFISGGFGGGPAGSSGSTTGSTASTPTTTSMTPNPYAQRLDAVVHRYLGKDANVVLTGADATVETPDSAARLRAMNATIRKMCKALGPVNTTNDIIYVDDSSQNDVSSCSGS